MIKQIVDSFKLKQLDRRVARLEKKLAAKKQVSKVLDIPIMGEGDVEEAKTKPAAASAKASKSKAKAKSKAKTTKAKAKTKSKPKATAKKTTKVTASKTPKAKAPAKKTAPKAKAPAKKTSTAKGDNLTKISGIGKVMAKHLNAAGIKTYKQLAKITKKQIAALDEAVPSFKARLENEKWIEQAKQLAK